LAEAGLLAGEGGELPDLDGFLSGELEGKAERGDG
jgi:hypothetical protein